MNRSKDRYPPKRRGPDGQNLCRGCGADVPKGRRTWCSTECYHKREPGMVLRAVKARDAEVCQLCGYDYRVAKAEWLTRREGLVGGYDEYRRWLRAKPMPIEYDHILPWSEGGPTVPENMRSLCRACHVKVTAEWRRTRKHLTMAIEEAKNYDK